ncbi:EAL domain-containing protein [Ralstonia insidiosa]|uniref:EAL domain-containing protein n=1 Tax=Ralstonia insidiosa TaxID=190721 RepID=A0A848NXP9_9RALS|nr:EAL domain-containing protein [Ralstonia insidiosa]
MLHDIGQPDNAALIAQKIKGALAEPIEIESNVVHLTASIGYAILGDDGHDIETLVRTADQRMLEVKGSSARAAAAMASTATRQELYGPEWAPILTSLTVALRPQLPAVVDRFYEQLTASIGSNALVEALSEPEFQHLKAQQVQNLLTLMSPELTQEHHQALALRVGHVHACVGLSREDLVLDHDILHTVLRNHVNTAIHREALSLVSRRRVRDLAWQMQAFQILHTKRHELLIDIADIAWKATSLAELTRLAGARLCQHEEISGCTFGGPDKQGIFRFQSAGGKDAKHFLQDSERTSLNVLTADLRLGQGPTGRAWRSGKIEHCLNLATDLRCAPWKTLAEQSGIRSTVAVPLLGPNGHPYLVLTLLNTWPGGYASAEHKAFLTQLQSSFVLALHRVIGKDQGNHVIPYTTRLNVGKLLKSKALEMFYQPILDLRTDKMMRVEALARLRDGDRMLTPAEFFPALSNDDFLELFVQGLDQVLAWRNRWSRKGFDIPVSLNLPTTSLTDPRYYDATWQGLQVHGCPPDKLTLEVLETDEIAPGLDVSGILSRFRTLGVHLAEDDLGAGHSSLARLNTLPFDIVKIDRSIVAPCSGNSVNVLRFIYQLTRLGHSLGKTVIVEGVENADLLNATRILGVDGAQGYVIACPMPSQQFIQWMEKSGDGVMVSRETTGSLSDLATFLRWEEQLHTRIDDPCFYKVSADPALADDSQNLPRLSMVSPAAWDSLMSAALSHGMRSAEYVNARDRLFAAITTGARSP